MACRGRSNGEAKATALAPAADGSGLIRLSAHRGSVACSDPGGCRAAVIRAYHELRRRGVADRPAFESGVSLLRYRHPELLAAEARDLAAEWISDSLEAST